MSKHYPYGICVNEKPTHVDSSYQEGSHFWYQDAVLPSRTVALLSPNTPGYRRLKSSGGRIPMNNYSKESYLWKNCFGSRICTRTSVGPPSNTVVTVNKRGLMYTANTPSEWLARYLFYTDFMYGWVPEQSDLVNSALSNVPHGPDILTFIAEFRELGELHKAVVDALKKCGRGRFSAPWLLWRYGISPLMSDVHELSELAASIQMKTHSHHGTYTSGKSSRESYELDLKHLKWTIETGDALAKKIIHTQEVTAEGSIYYQVNGIAQSPMTVNINPLLTAWERVPLSFVVDWVVDIGGLIDAFTVSSQIHEPEVALNYKFTFNSRAFAECFAPPDPYYTWRKKDEKSPPMPYIVETYDASHREGFNFSAVFKGRSVSRPSQVFPEIPRIRPNIGLFRQLDAMSLYSSFTSKELNSSAGRIYRTA